MTALDRTVLPLALLLAACGGGGGDGGSAAQALPPEVWTWVDVPGARCADGSQTGLAVNPAPASSTDDLVLVFLMGGGACWDPISCGQRTAEPGPYGREQFEADLRLGTAEGTILDRKVEGTPFGGATLVFVPYCTGDVHWGDATQDYLGAGTWRHDGASNLALAADWLEGHLDQPGKLVVSGSSAGGFGALLAHDLLRARWGEGTRGYLVDDSGPPLVGGDVPDLERAAWYLSWGLAQTVTPLCGAGCRDDLSQILPALAARYPDDRIALLSAREDPVIEVFLAQTPSGFGNALQQLVDERIAPLPNARAFLVPGPDHALLQAPAAYAVDEVPLPSWLGHMVHDDEGWTTLGQPAP